MEPGPALGVGALCVWGWWSAGAVGALSARCGGAGRHAQSVSAGRRSHRVGPRRTPPHARETATPRTEDRRRAARPLVSTRRRQRGEAKDRQRGAQSITDTHLTWSHVSSIILLPPSADQRRRKQTPRGAVTLDRLPPLARRSVPRDIW